MSQNDFAMLLLVLTGLFFLGFIIWFIVSFTSYNKKLKENENMKNAQLTERQNMWEQKVKQLGVDTNTPIINKHFKDSTDSYGFHVWAEDGRLCWFYAKPTLQTMHFECYLYPEQLYVYWGYPQRCYRTGSEGVRYEKDYSVYNAKKNLSDYHSGSLLGVMYAKDARDAAKNAPTREIQYDTRKTIVEFTDGNSWDFTIDSFEILQKLIPDKC